LNKERSRKHYRVCHLCEALCGIEVTITGEKVVAIRGDKSDPFSQGHICPKAVALQDLQLA
jgi:anaerobic selenocysteine-containing dehydrogenase